MRCAILSLIFLCQIMAFQELAAQKKMGELKNKTTISQTINFSEYHQWDLTLEKGTVALLNMTDFDVRTEMTVVNSEGILIEKVNTAETADFLVFEAPKSGKYSFYINTIQDEEQNGKYTITALSLIHI